MSDPHMQYAYINHALPLFVTPAAGLPEDVRIA